jgi:hypothetical protein
MQSNKRIYALVPWEMFLVPEALCDIGEHVHQCRSDSLFRALIPTGEMRGQGLKYADLVSRNYRGKPWAVSFRSDERHRYAGKSVRYASSTTEPLGEWDAAAKGFFAFSDQLRSSKKTI